jgi:hypothetical protein
VLGALGLLAAVPVRILYECVVIGVGPTLRIVFGIFWRAISPFE